MSYGKRERFYHSQAWKKTRANYIAYRKAIDGGLCEICHENIGNTVHHKIWLNDKNVDDPNISLNTDNFSLLCMECHAKQKEGDFNPLRRYDFDADGNIIKKSTPPIE